MASASTKRRGVSRTGNNLRVPFWSNPVTTARLARVKDIYADIGNGRSVCTSAVVRRALHVLTDHLDVINTVEGVNAELAKLDESYR